MRRTWLRRFPPTPRRLGLGIVDWGDWGIGGLERAENQATSNRQAGREAGRELLGAGAFRQRILGPQTLFLGQKVLQIGQIGHCTLTRLWLPL